MEDLAYRRMIDAYYLNERPFNGCSTDVAREVGMIEQLAAVEYVLSKFFVLVDGRFSNKRCDDEILKYRLKIEQASNAGKASVQRRLAKSSTDVEISPTDVQPTNNQEPRAKSQEPLKPLSDKSDDPDFQKFWSTYPSTERRTAKAKCAEIWRKRRLKDSTELIITHLLAMKTTVSWTTGFEPAPLTYLNQSRWLDGDNAPKLSVAWAGAK